MVLWQAGILAVGGTQRAVFLEGGLPKSREEICVTLSADERVLDGDLAAAFLEALASNMANPIKLLSCIVCAHVLCLKWPHSLPSEGCCMSGNMQQRQVLYFLLCSSAHLLCRSTCSMPRIDRYSW